MCFESLEQKKSEIDLELSEKLEEVRVELQDDITDNVDSIHEDIDKIASTLNEVESWQDNCSVARICKELGKWYHHLKHASTKGVAGHGSLIQEAIMECIDETKFAILLDLLEDGALEWKNPEKNNMNALQFSWAKKGAESLTIMIGLRMNEHLVTSSESEVLGEWYERVQCCSNTLNDQLVLYGEALSIGSPLYFRRVVSSKFRHDVQEFIANEDTNLLQEWLPKLKFALSGDESDKSRLLFEAKCAGVPMDSNLLMCEVFGDHALEHMNDHVCFDPSNSNVKKITNNNMTIKGTCKDNYWHGGLLNEGISEGIAEWEVNIDSTNHNSEMGIGIFEKGNSRALTLVNKNTIGFDGNSGYKFIRGVGTQYCEKWQGNSTSNGVMTLHLDMIKGELSMKMNGVDKGIMANGLNGKTWWPFFSMVDYNSNEIASFTLKSFKYL